MPRLRAALLAALSLITLPALAGDPTPPPGPVTGTMKTLTQVEPRTPLNDLPGDAAYMVIINQPGSYYLTADIVASGARHGIRVAADSVTIDLNGFRLRGEGHLPSIAIVTSGNRTGFTLRNGTISNWGYASLNIGGFMTHCLFEDLAILDNLAGGLQQAGLDHSVFRNIRVRGQSETGIAMGDNCVMSHCTVEGSFIGIAGLFNCTVTDCAVFECQRGIQVFGNGLIERCTARSCKLGLTVGSGGAIRDCIVSGGETAIQSSGFARVEDCVVTFATIEGIRASQKDVIRGSKISNCPIGINSPTAAAQHAMFDANVITTCPIGIRVLGQNNIITRNIIIDASTAPFDITPGNALAPVHPSPTTAGPWDNLSP